MKCTTFRRIAKSGALPTLPRCQEHRVSPCSVHTPSVQRTPWFLAKGANNKLGFAAVSRQKTLYRANQYVASVRALYLHPEMVLQAGMVFDVKPSFRLKSGGTAQFGDSIVVTENGARGWARGR